MDLRRAETERKSSGIRVGTKGGGLEEVKLRIAESQRNSA